jgi:hypothetical protein
MLEGYPLEDTPALERQKQKEIELESPVEII